jgi:hypothetical protein
VHNETKQRNVGQHFHNDCIDTFLFLGQSPFGTIQNHFRNGYESVEGIMEVLREEAFGLEDDAEVLGKRQKKAGDLGCDIPVFLRLGATFLSYWKAALE